MGWLIAFTLILAPICIAEEYVKLEKPEDIECSNCEVSVDETEISFKLHASASQHMYYEDDENDKTFLFKFDVHSTMFLELWMRFGSHEIPFQLKHGTSMYTVTSTDGQTLCQFTQNLEISVEFKDAGIHYHCLTTPDQVLIFPGTVEEIDYNNEKLLRFDLRWNVKAEDVTMKLPLSKIFYDTSQKRKTTTTATEASFSTSAMMFSPPAGGPITDVPVTSASETGSANMNSTVLSEATIPTYAYFVIAGAIIFFAIVVIVVNVVFAKFF